MRPRLSNCPVNERSVESWLGVSASLGECWVDCTMNVGQYNWALYERMGTETLDLPTGGIFCMRIRKAGWPERELGGCFSLSLWWRCLLPEAFASGIVIPYCMVAYVEHLLLHDLGVMEWLSAVSGSSSSVVD